MLTEMEVALVETRRKCDTGDARIVDLFLTKLHHWRQDDSSPKALMDSLDRILGYGWLSTNKLYEEVFGNLQKFSETVRSLGGMTVNERLVMFDLMDRWDAASDTGRERVRRKLEVSAG